MPLTGLYVSALASLNLNARVLSASGHQPNPAPSIAPQVKRMHELMVQRLSLIHISRQPAGFFHFQPRRRVSPKLAGNSHADSPNESVPAFIE